MTANMRLLFGKLPLLFLLMLFVLGKTFDSINFLCYYLMVYYMYNVLVKGRCPAFYIGDTIKTGILMVFFVTLLSAFLG